MANSYSSFRSQLELRHPQETLLTGALRSSVLRWRVHANPHSSTHAAACPCSALRLHHHMRDRSWHHLVWVFPGRYRFHVLSYSHRSPACCLDNRCPLEIYVMAALCTQFYKVTHPAELQTQGSSRFLLPLCNPKVKLKACINRRSALSFG